MKKAAQHQTGHAAVNGLKMYYEIHGEGKPLVLVHGGGSTIDSTFGTILPLLAERCKVIAVELQAHGRTSDRDAPESFEQDADDVAELMRVLNIDNADFFGFSNGGNTVMRIATRHAKLVNKLVVASALYKREGMVKGFFDGLGQATLDSMPAYLKEAFLKVHPDTAALQNMFEKDKARMLRFRDWSEEDLASIQAPSLVMVGDRDVVTPEHTMEMARTIPNAALLVMPGDHGSFIGEASSTEKSSQIPRCTVAIVMEFLEAAGR